jgi:hypothetical protein
VFVFEVENISLTSLCLEVRLITFLKGSEDMIDDPLPYHLDSQFKQINWRVSHCPLPLFKIIRT